MRDYYKVPDIMLMNEDISAFDILDIAVNHMNHTAYMNNLEEAERKRLEKKYK